MGKIFFAAALAIGLALGGASAEAKKHHRGHSMHSHHAVHMHSGHSHMFKGHGGRPKMKCMPGAYGGCKTG